MLSCMEQNLGPVFLNFSIDKLNQFAARIKQCLERLSHDQVWARRTENENAIGNLVLHLCGNVRQWIGSGVAGKPDVRQRDREFAERGEIQPAELWQRLERTVADAVTDLRQVPPGRLQEFVTIQSYHLTVMEAVYHVVEHFAQHTGQIILATKQFTGEDLGFYKHLSKPATHDKKTP
jgi:uncharacterized damage-inducible protein DinB